MDIRYLLISIARSEFLLRLICVCRFQWVTSGLFTNTFGQIYFTLTHNVDSDILHDQPTIHYVMGILYLFKTIQYIVIIRSRMIWIWPPMVLSFFLDAPVCSRLLISWINFNNLVYPFNRKSTCLEIINMLLIVPPIIILVYIIATL